MSRRNHQLIRTWNWLIGDAVQFYPSHRAFNAISVISLVILVILLPFNAMIGLWPVCVVLLVLILLQSIFYYLARFRGQYLVGLNVYAVVSYLTLILNFFFNSGSYGPTLLLFLLTFQLLIAFTSSRQHAGWMMVHLIVPFLLLLCEYYMPEWVPDSYRSRESRYFDLSTSYLVIVVCMYCVTIYLRNNYRRQRRTAEERANKIEQQNKQILVQNRLLEELNQEKTKLFSIISHDLKSPLNSIISVLELLTEQDLDPQERMEFKKDLLNITRNTSDMLLNILSWSSAQIKGTYTMSMRIQLADVVQKVLKVQRILAEKKEIRIVVEIGEEAVVQGDWNMLELIIRNLLNNAIKFTPKQGTIALSAAMRGDYCLLAVRDTGIGMPREQQEQLFSLKVQSTYGTENETGIGLGLHLCREFAEAQGGSMYVESTEGQGSTFYVRLPVPDKESE